MGHPFSTYAHQRDTQQLTEGRRGLGGGRGGGGVKYSFFANVLNGPPLADSSN